MKKKKRLLAILLVLILSVSTAGCSKFAQQNQSASDTTSSKRITPEDVKERVINQATEYLKKNYPDDNFSFISAASPNWADNYYKVGFKTEKYNNQQVMVYGSSSDKKDEDGFTIYTYSDDYYKYYMKDDAEKYFYDIAKKLLGDEIIVKVGFPNGIGTTKKVTHNMKFSEYLSSKISFVDVYYFYDEINLQNIDKFISSIKDNFKIYFCFGRIINKKNNYIKSNYLYEINKNASEIYKKEKSYILSGDGTIS